MRREVEAIGLRMRRQRSPAAVSVGLTRLETTTGPKRQYQRMLEEKSKRQHQRFLEEQSTGPTMRHRRMLEVKSTDLKMQHQTIRPMGWL
jgi:hypothetical protein